MSSSLPDVVSDLSIRGQEMPTHKVCKHLLSQQIQVSLIIFTVMRTLFSQNKTGLSLVYKTRLVVYIITEYNYVFPF